MKPELKRKRGLINVSVEKTETGYSAHSEKYPVYTTGRTAPELLNNVKEALNFYFEDEGKYITQDNIKLNIDFTLFFQHYKVLNAKFLAKRIGMNPTLLSQYVQGKKSPSRKQTNKILEGIHEIGRELSELNLVR
ncbi:type II toxin-antitoxin system HicB family antitoxin [Ekhidna sp.]|uniref:type II toxin-antitoxin system HicB family antitoxin n=1 Tax=Ekhidna sp. TaxID=2608089 RepID=UPI003CCB8A20